MRRLRQFAFASASSVCGVDTNVSWRRDNYVPLPTSPYGGANRPNLLYRTAACKHVAMMEAHLFATVENNVFGTLNVVRAGR